MARFWTTSSSCRRSQIVRGTLMSTAASNDVDFRLPWRATLIELPPGLLSTDVNGIDEPICHVLASVFPNIEGKDHWAIMGLCENGAEIHCIGRPRQYIFNDAIAQEAMPGTTQLQIDSRDERTLALMWRLVAGVCLMMSDPSHSTRSHSTRGGGTKSKRSGEGPSCMFFELRSEVAVDCRPAINDFIAGRRRDPSALQWLVRGHWRNQACGVDFQERRPTWIKPYWKGDEDGPIAMRDHVPIEQPQ